MFSRCVFVVAASVVISAPLQGQLETPTDWRWVLDEPARLVTEQAVPDSAWRFVSMPPGWHVTTGPGAVLFHPDYAAHGRYSVQAEMFLFPGERDEEYGIVVGGARLESGVPQYTAFVVRRDGHAAVLQRRGEETTVLSPWMRHEAVVPHTGSGTAKNVLRIEADSAGTTFVVNDSTVARVARVADGHVGFRVGGGVNLHASTLDLTYHLAPPRPAPSQ